MALVKSALTLPAEPDGAQPRCGDYKLIDEIARGGMGVVWRARQVSLERDVALKMILAGQLATSTQVLRFFAEARAVARLDHPHIVPIYEISEDEGRHFYTMKLMSGGSLAERIRSTGKPTFTFSARAVATIARAVHFAHQRGVLHRDLKPSNILLDADGEPHVSDFGLAHIAESDFDVTRSGAVLGSPAYMAPEQAAGNSREVTSAADVYSLGAILYELLTGRPPFRAETPLGTLRLVLERAPEAPRIASPGLDRDLETICLKCLEKLPAQRYASAEALAEDLERWLAGIPIRARPVSALRRTVSWARRRPELAALGAALLVAVLAGAAGVVSQWRRAENHSRDLELQAYAADVFEASGALQRGELGRARTLLEPYLPAPGGRDLRGFEWRCLWGHSQGDEHVTLRGHAWIVTAVAASSSGRWLASGSQDKIVQVWDISSFASPRHIASLSKARGAIWSVAFLPDETLLLASASDNLVRFWRTDTWLPTEQELPGQLFALSPGGELLVTTQASPWSWEGKPGPVTIWDWPSRTKLPSPPEPGRVISLTRDGRTLAFAGEVGKVHLWDAREARSLGCLSAAGSAWALCFSPDGRLLAIAGQPEKVEIWDWRARARIHELPGHDGVVWSAVFSPNGGDLVTSASDQRVRVWDVSTWRLKKELRGHLNEVWCAAFSPDGKRLVTGGKDQLVLIWPMGPGTAPAQIRNHSFTRPVFSLDGTTLVTDGGPPNAAKVVRWDARTGQRLLEQPAGFLAGFTGNGGELCTVDADSAVFELRAADTLLPARRVPIQGATAPLDLGHTSWSVAKGVLLSVRSSGQVHVWASTGRELAGWQCAEAPVRAAAISQDARRVVIAPEGELENNRFGVLLRDLATGKERRLLGHRDLVQGLGFSRDNRMLATGSMDGTIQLWDVERGAALATLPGHLQDTLAVAFSPDGCTLASLGSGRDVKLWHLATRREVASFAVPGAGDYLEFSPDGHWLAVNTRGGEIRLFEAQ